MEELAGKRRSSPRTVSRSCLLNTTAAGQLEQVAPAVENVEIANLKRLQFCWFAGKTNSAVPEDLRGRSKGR
jgi:hypothetical protein